MSSPAGPTVRDRAHAWLYTQWYGRRRPALWLQLLAALFAPLAALRRLLYRFRVLQSTRLPVPVVVVGNITVGGSGKTPFVIWLCAHLKARGLVPGVVTRGYGGSARHWPKPVSAGSDVVRVGDESVLLARRCCCPVYAGPDRVAAARALLACETVDVIISDDGLQHYALGRNCEIIMLDGERGLGNGRLLPAGPLREPPSRLAVVQLVIIKQSRERAKISLAGALRMKLALEVAVNLISGESRPLTSFGCEPVHAVAGIAHPDDFFIALADQGLTTIAHAHADHAEMSASDINFCDNHAVLMTEKDAVKCARFASSIHWYVPVRVFFEPADEDKILHGITRLLPAVPSAN